MYVSRRWHISRLAEILSSSSVGSKVIVASKEFRLGQDSVKDVLDYLEGCLLVRFVPWVHLER